jgi:hypothetical protein
MKCPKCNSDEGFRQEMCKFCFGKPDLDWIEVIFGVKYDWYMYWRYTK